MSMKWVGCTNNNQQHDPSEKLRNQVNHQLALCVNQAYIRLGLYPFDPSHSIAGAEKLNIYMKKTCYEY
jgi:hypothetical protein